MCPGRTRHGLPVAMRQRIASGSYPAARNNSSERIGHAYSALGNPGTGRPASESMFTRS